MEYPLLAYKDCVPKDNQVAVIHLAQNMPVRNFDLKNNHFICFVNHETSVEKKIFQREHE